MSTCTLTTIPPAANTEPTTEPTAAVTCEFDTRQGIWHLEGGHDSFYSVSLDRALTHAQDIYGDVKVSISITDPEIDRMLGELDRCEPGATTCRSAIRDQLQRYLDVNEIPLGSEDVLLLSESLPFDDRASSLLAGWEPVVIAAAATPSPTDRVVAAVIDGDRLVVLLNGERRRNRVLLEQGGFFVRHAADGWTSTAWSIDSVEPVSEKERRRIEGATSAPLAVANLAVHAHRRDNPEAIVVPIASPADIAATTGVVAYLAENLDRPIEYVFAVEPEALFPQDVDQLIGEVESIGRAGPITASARLIISDSVDDALLAACRGRLTCMKTRATPFESSTFVGSHAAALLEVTNKPVILIGPNVDATRTPTFEDITIALGGEDDEIDLLQPARRLAKDLGVPTRCLHVVTPCDENLIVDRDGTTRFWYPGVAHTALPVDTIAPTGGELGRQLAEATTNSMLAMTTHARRGLDRIANGSVTFDAINEAVHPILAIGPNAGLPGENEVPATETTVVDSGSALHELLAARDDFHEACDATYRPMS